MNRFQKWALATTAATYLLIMIGGLVRASDAGLGCPDWPGCFGKPYPPFTHEEFLQRDIPADFDVENFHVTLAWIEYTNRLSGSVIGLLIMGTLYVAYKDHRRNKRIFYPVIAAFITVLINGWMGGQVIESRLKAIVISIHLLLALVQVSLLLYATVSAFFPIEGIPEGEISPQRQNLARAALVVLFLALIQIGLGADVRGQMEQIEEDNPQMERGDFIHETDWVYKAHRSFSWIVMLSVLGLAWYAHKRMDYHPWLRMGTQLAALLVLLQVAAGVGLAYANLPPPLQVIHLLLASLLIGAITAIYLLATRLPIQNTVKTRPELGSLQPAPKR